MNDFEKFGLLSIGDLLLATVGAETFDGLLRLVVPGERKAVVLYLEPGAAIAISRGRWGQGLPVREFVCEGLERGVATRVAALGSLQPKKGPLKLRLFASAVDGDVTAQVEGELSMTLCDFGEPDDVDGLSHE